MAALLLAVAVFESASAAGYILESLTVKGSGYRSDEIRAQTAPGSSGQKLAETSSGTGSSNDRFRLEIDPVSNSINYSRDAEFEYFPMAYNNETYDQKWKDLLCMKNYDAGAQVTEAYREAEHLQKTTEIRAIGNASINRLVAEMNSKVIGAAHIGWASNLNTTGHFMPIGKSAEDMTGVFSIDRYIELLQNSSGSTGADWMPCA